jgi:tRNA modification GTPase
MIGDTIAAISTPLGEGGIGIVRVSGPQAISIAEKIFQPYKQRDLKKDNFRLIYGYVHDPEDKEIIDEVLLGVMRAPHTYTREDVVEINCHGGILPLRKTLELVLSLGARLAEPGEFTKRAFLNGRLDMAQAEAIIDIIRATTDDALRLAVGQLKGGLSKKINAIQQELLQITALIEASIDFPEDDVDAYDLEDIYNRVESIRQEIEKMLAGAETGKIYREGLKTVIAGKPNVGKSSLLNVLLREKRAIVTDIPGTTRDIIEEVLNINGIPLRIIDTAGIRETEDVIEKIGVQKTRESIDQADLVLLVFDAETGFSNEDEEIIDLVKQKKGIKILNKIDLKHYTDLKNKLSGVLPGWPLVEISAIQEAGIDDLEKVIYDLVTQGRVVPRDGTLVSNVRHKNQLKKALENVKEAQAAIKSGLALDLIAVDIRGAWQAIGEINGTAITENIVDKIFEEFCIGK